MLLETFSTLTILLCSPGPRCRSMVKKPRLFFSRHCRPKFRRCCGTSGFGARQTLIERYSNALTSGHREKNQRSNHCPRSPHVFVTETSTLVTGTLSVPRSSVNPADNTAKSSQGRSHICNRNVFTPSLRCSTNYLGYPWITLWRLLLNEQ